MGGAPKTLKRSLDLLVEVPFPPPWPGHTCCLLAASEFNPPPASPPHTHTHFSDDVSICAGSWKLGSDSRSKKCPVLYYNGCCYFLSFKHNTVAKQNNKSAEILPRGQTASGWAVPAAPARLRKDRKPPCLIAAAAAPTPRPSGEGAGLSGLILCLDHFLEERFLEEGWGFALRHTQKWSWGQAALTLCNGWL